MENVKNYAVINSETNIVENVVLWDGRTKPLEITAPEIIKDEQGNDIETGNLIIVDVLQPWMPPVGTYVVCIEGIQAGIDWLYNDGEFIDAREGSSELPPSE